MRMTLVAVSACCVLLLGCGVIEGGRSRGPTPEDISEMMEAQMGVFQQQLDTVMALVAEYRDLGVVEAQISPGDATLYLDGGEYLDTRDEIVLPVGTHEFKAVWSDGKEASQKVYVGPARITMNINFNFRQTGRSGGMTWDNKGSEVKKTVVRLQKP